MKCKPYSEVIVEIRTQLETVKITLNIFAVWIKFLGKNIHLVGCATVFGKSEVMLMYNFELDPKIACIIVTITILFSLFQMAPC